MALDVTIGGSAANSFNTLEETADYLDAAPFDTSAWSDLAESLQEELTTYGPLAMDWMPLRGYRVYAAQALPFPRTHQADTTEIPEEVKKASAYISFLLGKSAFSKLETEASSIGKAEVKSVTLEGLVSMTFASENLERQGGAGPQSLMRLFLSREFPIWMLMARHLTRFRCFGAASRPTLLDQVT